MTFEIGDIVRITFISEEWLGQLGTIATVPKAPADLYEIDLFTPPYDSGTVYFPAQFLEHV